MTITYALSLESSRNQVWIAMWGSLSRAARTLVITLFLPVGVFLGAFVLRFNIPLSAGLITASLVGIAVWGILFNILAAEWLARYGLKLERRNGDTRQVTLDEEGIRIAMKDTEAHHGWRSITGLQETAHGFVIYKHRRPFLFIPKSAQSAEQWEATRSLFRFKVSTT